MENPDNEDIIIQIEEILLYLFLWPNNFNTFFPFPVMFYLPCADHVLLFVDDVVTSWPQSKISDWSEKGSWYKKLHDTSIAILALPCNRALRQKNISASGRRPLTGTCTALLFLTWEKYNFIIEQVWLLCWKYLGVQYMNIL
jgi:hypothetical protein